MKRIENEPDLNLLAIILGGGSFVVGSATASFYGFGFGFLAVALCLSLFLFFNRLNLIVGSLLLLLSVISILYSFDSFTSRQVREVMQTEMDFLESVERKVDSDAEKWERNWTRLWKISVKRSKNNLTFCRVFDWIAMR